MPLIDHYRIEYMSSSDHPWAAEIRCYGPGERYETNALIRFYEDPASVPSDGWVGDVVNGTPIVNYELARFEDLITILRDESYVSVDEFEYDSGSDFVRAWGVATGPEPPGDMEP